MQSRQELVRRCGLFQLLNVPAQPHLFRLRNNEEFDADPLRPAPAHRGIFNLEGSGLAGNVQQESDLHSRKRRDEALHSTTFGGEIADRALVSELVALDQSARHVHEKTPMFARNHNWLPSCSVPMQPATLRGTVVLDLATAVPRLYTIPVSSHSPVNRKGIRLVLFLRARIPAVFLFSYPHMRLRTSVSFVKENCTFHRTGD